MDFGNVDTIFVFTVVDVYFAADSSAVEGLFCGLLENFGGDYLVSANTIGCNGHRNRRETRDDVEWLAVASLGACIRSDCGVVIGASKCTIDHSLVRICRSDVWCLSLCFDFGKTSICMGATVGRWVSRAKSGGRVALYG